MNREVLEKIKSELNDVIVKSKKGAATTMLTAGVASSVLSGCNSNTKTEVIPTQIEQTEEQIIETKEYPEHQIDDPERDKFLAEYEQSIAFEDSLVKIPLVKYKVLPGDNIYSIAKQFVIDDPNDNFIQYRQKRIEVILLSINHMDNNSTLYANTIIYLPSKEFLNENMSIANYFGKSWASNYVNIDTAKNDGYLAYTTLEINKGRSH